MNDGKAGVSSTVQPKMHKWVVEEREYARQEERRGRRFAYENLDSASIALIVIDMVPFFVEQNGYCQGIVPNINRLAEQVRITGGKVVWVVPAPKLINQAAAQEFFGDEVYETFRISGGSGNVRQRLSSRLSTQNDDLYFEKTAYSAFFPGSCQLPEILSGSAIDTVIIAGTVTNICCESSARDAFTRGFRVIFLTDGTAARRDQDHNAALCNIYRSFGDVRATEEIIEILRKSSHR